MAVMVDKHETEILSPQSTLFISTSMTLGMRLRGFMGWRPGLSRVEPTPNISFVSHSADSSQRNEMNRDFNWHL